MKKIIAGISGLLMIGGTTLISSAITKEENTAGHFFSAPFIETADGKQIEISMGGFRIDSLDGVDAEYGKKLCKTAGLEYSAESLNSIWFGENIFGAGSASAVYFGKSFKTIDKNSLELLCSIAENPEKYSDILSGNSQNPVFNSHSEYASAIPESAYFDAMIHEIITDISEKYQISRNEAAEMLYSEGVVIHSPYSDECQRILDDIYSDNSVFTDFEKSTFPQSACVIMNKNGEILAVAGGNNGNNAYNRAYRSLHRTGSSIKPLSVYTLSLINNRINFSSLIPDEPLKIPTGNTYYEWPDNYNGLNEGNVTATYALRQSKNTVAVQLAEMIGAPNCKNFLVNELGLDTLTEADACDSAMAMGYLENGVPLYKLAAAYNIFTNEGVYSEPGFYTDVVDSEGRIIVENEAISKPVISPEDAWIMNRLLRNNIAMPDGIAKAAENSLGIEVIGKTGTVDNEYSEDCEKVFVGATPDYTIAVWTGFDNNNVSIEDFSYTAPTLISKKIIESLPYKNTEFEADKNVIAEQFCTETGMLAGEKCFNTEKGYYKKDNIPDVCSLHK